MAWETLTWWLRNRESLRPTHQIAPADQGRSVSPAARVTPELAEVVARMVEQLADALQRGAGGRLRSTQLGRRLLASDPSDRGLAMVYLARAIRQWPVGSAVAPSLAPGPRVLTRFLDELAQQARVDESQLIEILSALAHLRPSIEPLRGVVRAAEDVVERGDATARLRGPLRDLRHGLPLEARALRHRVQQLLRRLDEEPP